MGHCRYAVELLITRGKLAYHYHYCRRARSPPYKRSHASRFANRSVKGDGLLRYQTIELRRKCFSSLGLGRAKNSLRSRGLGKTSQQSYKITTSLVPRRPLQRRRWLRRPRNRQHIPRLDDVPTLTVPRHVLQLHHSTRR